VVKEIKASPMLSFKIDATKDVSSYAPLLVLVRYIHSGNTKEEFPFCSEPGPITTSAEDDNFFAHM